jgi:predicted RNA methylase
MQDRGLMVSLSPFVSSPMERVRRMLTLAEVRTDDVVYDLGSGDGRIVIAAVRDFKAKRAVGIELRSDLVKKARSEIRRLKLEDKIEIIQGDAVEVNINEADVVTLYLTSRGNEILKPKLEKELKHGARVVSRNYKISGWEPIKVDTFWPFRKIYLYQR